MLDLIDAGKVSFVVGVNLSYLSEVQQTLVYQICIVERRAKLDVKLSDEIRRPVSVKALKYTIKQHPYTIEVTFNDGSVVVYSASDLAG